MLSPAALSEFMAFLASAPHPRSIRFDDFRDYFLLLPHKISPAEIYKYYEMTKFLGDDGRGAARVTMEGLQGLWLFHLLQLTLLARRRQSQCRR